MFDRLEIEVIGRLVQDEVVGIFQERSRERGARALTARERSRRATEILLRETERREHFTRTAIGIGRRMPFVGFARFAVLVERALQQRFVFGNRRIRELFFERANVVFQLEDVREGPIDDFAESLRIVRARGLVEVAQACFAREHDATVIGRQKTRENTHERRLPRTVCTDEPDLRAIGQRTRDALEDESRAVRAFEIVEPNPIHG